LGPPTFFSRHWTNDSALPTFKHHGRTLGPDVGATHIFPGARRRSRRRSVLESHRAIPPDCGNSPGARSERDHLEVLNARIRYRTIAVSPGLAGRTRGYASPPLGRMNPVRQPGLNISTSDASPSSAQDGDLCFDKWVAPNVSWNPPTTIPAE